MSRAQQIAAEVNAVMGTGSMKVGSDPSLVVRYLPTGVLPVDVLLKGGLPRGRMTEVFGDFSSLKSYVALRAIATTQQAGGTCVLVDTEHSYDPEWLAQLGGDPDELLLEQPDHGETAVAETEILLRSGAVDLIVWDSVSATFTKSQWEKQAADDTQPARLAAFMSRFLPRLVSANTGKTAFLWINQTRMNIGITFGSPEVTSGGRALPYFASYRVRFQKAGQVKEASTTWDGQKYVATKVRVGQKIRAQLEKSKLNSPDREVWFTFDQRTGDIDDVGFLVGQGLEAGLVTMSNARFALAGWKTTVHGIEKFKASLSEEDVKWLTTELTGSSGGMPSLGAPQPVKRRGRRPKGSS